MQRIDGATCLAAPKTACSHRTLPVPLEVLDVMRAHRIRQVEERLAMGGAWDGWGDLVFTTAKGKPLEAGTTTKLFQKTLELHGLPRIRFHDLRHSCASIMLAKGVGARTIMEQLGTQPNQSVDGPVQPRRA